MRFKRGIAHIAWIGVLAACCPASAADSRQLTLQEAIRLAVGQNRDLKITRLKIVESEQKKAEAKSNYFPQIKNESEVSHLTALENLDIPAGAFGLVPNAGLVPSHDVLIGQGSQTLVTSGTTLSQPLTQLIRIRQSNRIAASEVATSRDELKKTENEVAVQVHQLYFGILVARLQKRAADQEAAYEETLLRESEEDVQKGSALKVSTIQNRAGLLQSQQSALTAELQVSDLTTELNDLLGLPLDTQLELTPVEATSLEEHARDEYLKIAYSENPEIKAAAEAVEKAKAGVTAAKSAYIPDVTAFARERYQNGVPFLVHNFGVFGVSLSYDVFDFGKRRAVVRQREAELAQAQENLEKLKEGVGVQIERSYHKVERTKQMLQVANEVVRLRAESERLAQNQMEQGIVLVSARRQASAASYQAEAGLLQAQLAYLLAGAELEQAAGRTPGL
jgi:outer membrane protein TolC